MDAHLETAPPAPPPAGRDTDAWIPATAVQARARAHHLGRRELRRYTAAGLLAPSSPRGREVGLPRRAWYYPARALDQVDAIAAARPHRVSPTMLRHLVWWRPAGRLEDWGRWRDDRVRECQDAAADAWQLTPATNGEYPVDRERAVVEMAHWWGKRHARRWMGFRLPRKPSDREALSRLNLSLVLGDDLLSPLADAGDPVELRGRLRSVLAEPIDGEPGEPGLSFGELLDQSLRRASSPTPVGAPGEFAFSLFALSPHPLVVAAELAVLSEARAMEARDVLLVMDTRGGPASGQLSTEPHFAGVMTVWWDRIARFNPDLAAMILHGS